MAVAANVTLSFLFSLSNLSVVSWLKLHSSVAEAWIKLKLLRLEMVQNQNLRSDPLWIPTGRSLASNPQLWTRLHGLIQGQ